MESKISPRPGGQLLLGLLAVILGVLFTLDNLNLIESGRFLRYWPAVLIAIGLVKLLQPGVTSGRMFGSLLVIVGTLMLLDRIEILNFRIHDYWPLVLVLIGGGLVWRALVPGTGPGKDPNSTVAAFAIMGGVAKQCNATDFRGGELTAIMGGCELDLTEAFIESGKAVINVFAFWGGIEIKVPKDWTVICQAVPIMGGVEDKTKPAKIPTDQQLIIKGAAIMGAVEIMN